MAELTATSVTTATINFNVSTISFPATSVVYGSPLLTTIHNVTELHMLAATTQIGWVAINVTSATAATTSPTTDPGKTGTSPLGTGDSTDSVSATSTTGNETVPTSSSEGVSVGKAVGIGIGSAIAAAFLLALVAAVCFWRRRNSRRTRHASRTGEFLMSPTAKASSSVSSGHIQDKLPQPITRKDIEKEASRLEGAIRNYVENFTDCQTSSKRHYDGLQLNTSDLSEYSQYHVQWATLLQDNSKRHNALRMFIARVLAFRTSATGDSSSTLLPAEMLQMYQQIVSERDKDGESIQERCRRHSSRQILTQMQNICKILGVH
jgi:hypothetical protein